MTVTTRGSLRGTGTKDKGAIIEREDHALITSFTDPTKSYRIDEHGCDCPAAKYGGRHCKHTVLAECLNKTVCVRFGRRIVEKRIVELAHAAYRPVRASESLRDSYNLLLDALSERYATDDLKTAALRRHGRLVELSERRVA